MSHDLCSALAAVGRRLCSSLVNPESISALVACRLIPLDKCPGVRPIGVPRRLIAKAILRIIGNVIEEVEGPLQACASQDGGCEAAVSGWRSGSVATLWQISVSRLAVMSRNSKEERICPGEVENGFFTPLVLSATGGMAREATTFYKSCPGSRTNNTL